MVGFVDIFASGSGSGSGSGRLIAPQDEKRSKWQKLRTRSKRRQGKSSIFKIAVREILQKTSSSGCDVSQTHLLDMRV